MTSSSEANAAGTAAGPQQSGFILKWNDDRGFGFIQPEGAAETVFVHISAFGSSGRRPQEGDVVTFRIEQEQRRTKAVDARIKGLPLPDTVTIAYGVGLMWLSVYFLYLFDLLPLPWPMAGYLVMSIVTFGFYYVDKRRAEGRRWRITGTSLHVLEGLGGWPGALLAMAMLRHLTRKADHIRMLAAISAIHLVGWAIWYLRH
jgi:uncharacterized membrane protein YsdA (DUF1294 family)/cold shock CspA family protein